MKRFFIFMFSLYLSIPYGVFGESKSEETARIPGSGKGDGTGAGRDYKKNTFKGGDEISLLASLAAQGPCELVIAIFKRQYEVQIKAVYVPSSDLAKQAIEDGSNDILVAEGVALVETLRSKGIVLEEINLFSDTLALEVPKGNPGAVKTPQDLKDEAIKKIVVSYPVLRLKHSANNRAAQKLFEFFGSHYADKAFRTHGFKSSFRKDLADTAKTPQKRARL